MPTPVIQIGSDPDPDKRIRIDWGRSLDEHLEAKGVSRKQLQRSLEEEHNIEVSLQAISLWITGQTAPKPSVQIAIAKVLDVPARRLFPLEAA